MNIRLGAKRLCVVLSLLLFMAIFFAMLSNGEGFIESLTLAAAVSGGPWLAVYAVLWIIAGFRSDSANRTDSVSPVSEQPHGDPSFGQRKQLKPAAIPDANHSRSPPPLAENTLPLRAAEAVPSATSHESQPDAAPAASRLRRSHIIMIAAGVALLVLSVFLTSGPFSLYTPGALVLMYAMRPVFYAVVFCLLASLIAAFMPNRRRVWVAIVAWLFLVSGALNFASALYTRHVLAKVANLRMIDPPTRVTTTDSTGTSAASHFQTDDPSEINSSLNKELGPKTSLPRTPSSPKASLFDLLPSEAFSDSNLRPVVAARFSTNEFFSASHGFTIQFPDSWTVKTSSVPDTVIKAVRRDDDGNFAYISVACYEGLDVLPTRLKGSEMFHRFTNAYSETEYRLNGCGETNIGGRPAAWTRIQIVEPPYARGIYESYHIRRNSDLFRITYAANRAGDWFDANRTEALRSIQTFENVFAEQAH